MYPFTRRHYRWLRHLPRRKHLRGGRLHRLLGESLFAHDLWRPTRRTIAGGIALGVFIGFTPTMGAQLVLAAGAAFFLRVNVPAAMAGTFVTNPVTAPFIYPLQYKLGIWLAGAPELNDLVGYSGVLYGFARYAKPLWIGSLLVAAISAALVYAVVTILWRSIRHFTGRSRHQ